MNRVLTHNNNVVKSGIQPYTAASAKRAAALEGTLAAERAAALDPSAKLEALEVGLDTTCHHVILQSKHGSIDDSHYRLYIQSDIRECQP
jgi:hypothetical protein